MKPHTNAYSTRALVTFALLASLSLAGCAGGGSPTPLPRDVAANASLLPQGISFTTFTAGATPGFLAGAFAYDIAAGSNGDIWFTDPGTPAIGRISAAGNVTEFRTGLTPGAVPFVIAAAPDGSMWFTDFNNVEIGRITTSGVISEFRAPQYTNESSQGIGFGKNGLPWFITTGPNPLLVNVTPNSSANGGLSVTALPTDLSPDGSLTADSSGNLWFIASDANSKGVIGERTSAGQLKRIATKLIRVFLPCCPNSTPKHLAIGSDGNPWFTAFGFGVGQSPANWIGTVNGGNVSLYKVPLKGSPGPVYPSGFASGTQLSWFTGGDPFGPKGELWQTDLQGNQTGYALVTYDPLGLTVDKNGNPWFTSFWKGLPSQIVKVTVR